MKRTGHDRRRRHTGYATNAQNSHSEAHDLTQSQVVGGSSVPSQATETRPSPAMDVLAPMLADGKCSVCGIRDARMLVGVELAGGASTVLCGSHDLAYRRAGIEVSTEAELVMRLSDRRQSERRIVETGDVDELAQALTRAFTRERRASDRRLN